MNFLILKQLQNSVHECLIEDDSSLFKLMAWQWTDAKPFPEQYQLTYANLSPGFTVCYHDKNSLCSQNDRSYKQLSQRQPSVAVTVTEFYTWQYRLPLPSSCANAFLLTILWEGSSVTGSSPHKGQLFFVVILNKLLNKQPGCIWIFMEFVEYLISPPIFFSNKLYNISCLGNT